ncbi:hypothetical protein FHX76_002966 [Lysinibacter cavernae]|uniref:Uncharacterized protein n=1 Tax=Lysinibacter cavernae TaxID=1640652 RepID=A0A7X5R3Q2_9MICO|nr:hypothetical protein [Lysinibacter cavernae]
MLPTKSRVRGWVFAECFSHLHLVTRLGFRAGSPATR